MITDEQIEAALDYLRDTAKPAGLARSQTRTLDKYVDVIEAEQKVIARKSGKSAVDAKDIARASREYQLAIDAWGEAVKRDAEYTMLREAAASRIEAWRTFCSNARAEGKAYS